MRGVDGTVAVASSLLQITPRRIAARPGAPLSFELVATNDTRLLRDLDLRLVGLDGAMVATDPEFIRLPPKGSATVSVTVDIPFVTPGETSFGFELTDVQTGELFAFGDVDLLVEDVAAARLWMPTPHIGGLYSDSTEVLVTNTGTTPLSFIMEAATPDPYLSFEFDPPRFRIPAGESQTIKLTVQRRVKWFGARSGHVFDVYAHGSSQALTAPGQFRQAAVLPPILFKAVLVVALVIVLVMLVARLAIALINDQRPFTWQELENPPDAFEGRYGHTAVWVEFEPRDQPVGLSAAWDRVVDFVVGGDDLEEAMIIWGGEGADERLLATGAMYSVRDNTWTSITDADSPPAPRAGHGAVWTGDRMVIWGGETDDGSKPVSYGAQFDPKQLEWVPLPDSGLVPRRGHSTTWTGSELLVFGGETFDGVPLADGAVLRPNRQNVENTGVLGDLEGGSWQRMARFPGDPRSFHAAAWTGEYLIVFGGFSEGGVRPELARDAYAYEVDRNRWWDITRPTAPSGRACHQAVFTGEGVLFLGGVGAADLERAIAADDRVLEDPGFRGLCGIDVDSVVDPTPWLLEINPGEDAVSPPTYDWGNALTDAPLQLANRFSVRWTGLEATVMLPVVELNAVASVRYVPGDGFEALPVPTSDVLGFRTDFTTVWINGGVIVFGGRTDDLQPSPEGALLVLPDR